MILTVIYFTLVILSILAIHEAGHIAVARTKTIYPYEIGFGFGPVLWSKQHRGIDWKFRLLPLGAYVKMKDEPLDALKTIDYIEIVLGGVAINILMGVALMLLCPNAILIWAIGYLSLLLGLSNLLPIWPMDGWAALVLILRNRLNNSKPLVRLEKYGGIMEGGAFFALWVIFVVSHLNIGG